MDRQPLQAPVDHEREEESGRAHDESPRQQSAATHAEEIDLVEIWYDEVGFAARLVLLHVNEVLLSSLEVLT
jgi:hypothetical protein